MVGIPKWGIEEREDCKRPFKKRNQSEIAFVLLLLSSLPVLTLRNVSVGLNLRC